MSEVMNTKYERAISALANRKGRIQARIDAEKKKLAPCETTLTRLKKARLWIKDRIAVLRTRADGAREPLFD
jgi:uncharacterized protein YdcH (DUF465 family)